MVHGHSHRRQIRNPIPDALAFAEAAAEAIANANPFAEPDPDPQQTFVSIVYVTASKTFDGEIGGWTTMSQGNQQAASATAAATPNDADADATDEAGVASTSQRSKSSTQLQAQTTLKTSATGLPSSIGPSSTSVDADIPLLAATDSPIVKTPTRSSTLTTASETASASAKSTDGGMSAGGKAGLAIGILLLIGTFLALILFFFKKRRDAAKKGEQLIENNEKAAFAGAGRAASTRTTADAPRLSLRPVTQFMAFGERRQSRGNALALASSNNEKPLPSTGHESNRNNPFGNHAETIDSANANGPAIVNAVGPGGEISTEAISASTIGLARGASKRDVKPLDLTRSGPFMGPPSPAGTEFSMSSESPNTPVQTTSASGAAIAAAGGPPNSAVHRVQLDFKPSMDDELELRAGQLIRMLHEYDDGWALCIRLDRSRQGVCPRTCLSTRPVKPRPQQNGPRGPPPPGKRVPGQQPRPQSPSMNQGPRPMTPNGSQQARPMTPNGQQARPMTPNGPKYNPQAPASPNSQNRSRSNSATQNPDRRNSPPNPSPLNSAVEHSGPPPTAASVVHRKPVGQAL